jgi:hypothetical protein
MATNTIPIERITEFRTGVARDDGSIVFTVRTATGAVHYFAMPQSGFIDLVHQMTRDAMMLLASPKSGGA